MDFQADGTYYSMWLDVPRRYSTNVARRSASVFVIAHLPRAIELITTSVNNTGTCLT